VAAACLSAAVARRGLRAASIALPPLLIWNLLHVGLIPDLSSLRDTARYYAHAEAFERLRPLLEGRYRFSPVGLLDYSLIPKIPSLFRLPSIRDYEPQTSRRYAELQVRMARPRRIGPVSNHQFIFFAAKAPVNVPLANLTALRFVLTAPNAKQGAARMPGGLRFHGEIDGISFWENPTALSRAFFVPRAEVMADPAALLERLASSAHDPRQVALVEEPPPGGDLGSEGATGDASIVEDRSETLTVRVDASGPGFLFVSDQLYPGWEAEVNGAPTPVMRANYVFRLVRVPAGESTVVFRYRPLSLRVGTWVSATTAALLAVLLAVALHRTRGGPRVLSLRERLGACRRIPKTPFDKLRASGKVQ
jgi:hypothetical protein